MGRLAWIFQVDLFVIMWVFIGERWRREGRCRGRERMGRTRSGGGRGGRKVTWEGAGRGEGGKCGRCYTAGFEAGI